MTKEQFKDKLTKDMKEARGKMGQVELAGKLGVSRQTISNIEKGKYAITDEMIWNWGEATGHGVEVVLKPKK